MKKPCMLDPTREMQLSGIDEQLADFRVVRVAAKRAGTSNVPSIVDFAGTKDERH